jgi:hypothetical protein
MENGIYFLNGFKSIVVETEGCEPVTDDALWRNIDGPSDKWTNFEDIIIEVLRTGISQTIESKNGDKVTVNSSIHDEFADLITEIGYENNEERRKFE